MDAKERANFINAVGNAEKNTAENIAKDTAVTTVENAGVKKCPKCGVENVEEAMFCASCGTPLNRQKADMTNQAFTSVQEEKTESVQQPASEVPQEAESAFAKGLPEWDMVPPQVMVRRKGMRS